MRTWALLFLVACNHQNCGDNEAGIRAGWLEERASCWSIHKGDTGADDYALCNVPEGRWLCRGTGECWPLGPAVRVERVR